MNFDEVIDRKNTHSVKWDMIEELYGVSQENGIPMWVADMDFRPPKCVSNAILRMHENGIYGYFGDNTKYLNSIVWWMKIDINGTSKNHGFLTYTVWLMAPQ